MLFFNVVAVAAVFWSHGKMALDGPNWGQEALCLANADLADILGDMDVDWGNDHFGDFCRIPNFWISSSPDFQNLILSTCLGEHIFILDMWVVGLQFDSSPQALWPPSSQFVEALRSTPTRPMPKVRNS